MIFRHNRLLLPTLLLITLTPPALAGNWPQWRGPDGNSVSAETGLPLEWSEDKNVVWKCPLPDGASTPAVWGNDVFATAQKGDNLLLFKINKGTGKVEWERKVGT